MNNVLVIKTSVSGEQGQSNQLANQLTQQLPSTVKVVERDLIASDLGHLSGEEMGAWMTAAEERSPAQQALAALSDTLINEVKTADTLVIGMPMYNFGIPSNFKAWVDRIARAGVTFNYTAEGPVGLLENKKVVVLATRGGFYKDTPADTQTNYLKDVLGFIGLKDVEFIYAEGLAIDGKEERLETAKNEIRSLLQKRFV